MLIDARSIAEGTELVRDLCVVGAGPAGIAIVDRLRGCGLQICLIESGGFEPELSTQKLYRGVNVGHQYYRLDACRFRLFGGTTNRWGGWCRPLEPIDFERRDWVPWSGWPIGPEALEPYYEEAARLFQLAIARFDLLAWRDRVPEPFPLQSENFENTVFQYSPETNFGEMYGARLLGAPEVTTLLHANLIGIKLDPDSNRVGTLRMQALGRGPFSLRAKAVVLATGGIENPRLLLASRADRPAGLGNEHDLVGRFFMEHLHVPAGHLVPESTALNWDFYRKAAYNGIKMRGVITPTATAQRQHRLLSTSIAIERSSYAFGTPYVGWPPVVTFGPIRFYRTLRRSASRRFAQHLKVVAEASYGLHRRLSTMCAAGAALIRTRASLGSFFRSHSLYFRAEQVPDPESRISLAESRDALGVPEVRLDWRVNAVDTQSIVEWLSRLDADLSRSGFGRVLMPSDGWTEGIIGGPHQMGTTRMSADPRTGVVDQHCRVHSIENLYVAGSSVFTTGGYANPTFTIVALALRLADRLRARLS